MSLEDLRVTTHEDDGMWGITETTRLATREDVLVAVRELGAVEAETWQRGDGYWAISPPEDSPGRYLIVPLDTRDTE